MEQLNQQEDSFIFFTDDKFDFIDLFSFFKKTIGFDVEISGKKSINYSKSIAPNSVLYYDKINIAVAQISDTQTKTLLETLLIEDIEKVSGFSILPPEMGFSNESITPTPNWGIQKMRVDQSDLTGDQIKVAILDSGIDLDHVNLKNRIITEHTHNFINESKSVQDTRGHGTHVAGKIIGGHDNQGYRYGIAPNCIPYIGKVINSWGMVQPRNILAGIQWAIDNGCRVINLSLEKKVKKGESKIRTYEQAINKALENNLIVVAAAGNHSYRYVERPRYAPVAAPANCTNSLAISAIDIQNKIYRHANQHINRNQTINYIAPGVDIYSTLPTAINATGFGYLSGTSMAVPFITGIITLLWEKFPEANADFILNQLKAGTNIQRLSNIDIGNGMPNAPQKRNN